MTPSKRNDARLTCFVSAATQTDLGPVLAALESAGVSTRTALEIGGGHAIANSLVDAVLGADFVCIVIDGPAVNPNVAFEAGVASGSRRPIFVASSAPPDSLSGSPFADMAAIQYTHDPSGVKNLATAIDAFVRNVQPVAVRLAIDWDDLALQAGSRREASLIRAAGLNRRVAERLKSAGAYVSTDVGRIDIVAAFPSLGSKIGKVIVEVKSKFGNRVLHTQNEQKLREAMHATGSVLGLLVYGQPIDTEMRYFEGDGMSLFEEIDSGIVVASVDQLEKWSNEQILDQLTRLRNAVIHGRR